MTKRIGVWIAVAVAWGFAYAAKQFFGISDVWMGIAVVAVIGLIISFNIENRLQKLEERVLHNDYSGIIKQLEGERHVPQHQQPESLAAGGAVTAFLTPAHEILFEDFRWFAAIMNQHVSTPWSIEELNDTNIRSYGGPEIGRRYQVWYNACQVGTINVTVGGHSALHPEEFAENRKARVDLELSYLRFIRYGHSRSLISQIAFFVGPLDGTETADIPRAKADALAADALGGYLWDAVRQPDLDPTFDFSIDGPYELLRETTDHWKARGVDPFERWGGDRPKSNY